MTRGLRSDMFLVTRQAPALPISEHILKNSRRVIQLLNGN
jgi:hypothetical protein